MGFICNGFSIKWWRFDQDSKSHMRSTCQKLKSQVPAMEVEESCASCASCFRNSSDPQVTHEFHWLENFLVWPICPSLILYIPSLSIEMVRSLLKEKNPKKGFYNTPTLLERESYSFLERNLCSLLSFSLPLLYPLRGDLYQNTTHAHLECWECFWSLRGIGRCQGWRMQYGAYCGIRKAREDTVRLNLVGARSLEGLRASGRLGLKGLLLFMYSN